MYYDHMPACLFPRANARYLNDGFGIGLCSDGGCLYALWGDVYTTEPLDGASLTPAQEQLVIGGEASLWGEEINQNNLMSNLSLSLKSSLSLNNNITDLRG